MKSIPRGGLGNRLLNHFNLYQLALRLGVDYFAANKVDSQILAGMSRRRLVPLRFSNVVHFDREDVETPEFIEVARQAIKDGSTIVLRPKLLLASFVALEDQPLGLLSKLRAKQCPGHRRTRVKKSVVLHLRGGDFAQWNPEATLSSDYYISSLQRLSEEIDDDTLIRICTDDKQHPALPQLTEFIEKSRYRRDNAACSGALQCDFRSMVDANFLVCSPSTLSISAALLGNAKTLHSEKWLMSSGKSHELFWTSLRDRNIFSIDVYDTV